MAAIRPERVSVWLRERQRRPFVRVRAPQTRQGLIAPTGKVDNFTSLNCFSGISAGPGH